MNDYMYLFTVFIAMGAVTAAERLLPFGSARLDRLSTRPWRSPCSGSRRRLPHIDCPMVC